LATYRQIHIKIWSSPDFQRLDSESKFIFIYLFSNAHRNEAALYRITPKTISNETDLSVDIVISSLSRLSDDNLIKWDQENNIVWVVNAIKYQKLSPNEVTGIKKNLANIEHQFVDELLTYYKDTFSKYEVPSKELGSNSEVPSGKGKGKGKGNIKKDLTAKEILDGLVLAYRKTSPKTCKRFGVGGTIKARDTFEHAIDVENVPHEALLKAIQENPEIPPWDIIKKAMPQPPPTPNKMDISPEQYEIYAKPYVRRVDDG